MSKVSKRVDCASPAMRIKLDALGKALGSAMEDDWNHFHMANLERDNKIKSPVKHLKRNKRGHKFIDREGIHHSSGWKCDCGLTVYEWMCKWRWS